MGRKKAAAKRPRLTGKQANYVQSKAKESKKESDEIYKAALKEATTLYKSKSNKLGLRRIAADMNNKDKLRKRKLNHETVHQYIGKNKIGQSPDARGPLSKIPMPFCDLLNCHIAMTQLEGKEETTPRFLKVLIGAALMETEYSHLSAENIYSRFRDKYPDTVCPTKIMEMEERRHLWTTYPNVNNWFSGSKVA